MPAAQKMSKPRYQGILSAQTPRVELGKGTYVRVIAGELHHVKGPANTFTPVNVFDVRVDAGGVGGCNLPAGQNSAVVLPRGDVLVDGEALKGEAKIAPLRSGSNVFSLKRRRTRCF